MTALCGVVLAAGHGTRLQPLTAQLPKALCPVGNEALLDHALRRVGGLDAAVNAHHHAALIQEHLMELPVHVSVEPGEALGTAGGVANLKHWIDGRGAVVTNADAWWNGDLGPLITDWAGDTVRLAVVPSDGTPDFENGTTFAGTSLLPWDVIAGLANTPSGAYEAAWMPAQREGRLELIHVEGNFIDCGTPTDYWLANMDWSSGGNVVDPSATVAGTINQCVLWAGAVVAETEHLERCIRLSDGTTVQV